MNASLSIILIEKMKANHERWKLFSYSNSTKKCKNVQSILPITDTIKELKYNVNNISGRALIL